MVPMNNTTMEAELPAWLPEGSVCVTQRIPRGKGTLTPDDLPEYVAQAMKLGGRYKSEDVDLVVYGCTAAGFMMGPSRDAQIAAELERITGKRVVTTASAMTEVLRHIAARNIAIVTPYSDMVNERLRKFVEDCGIAVGVLASFRTNNVDELAAITPGEIAKLARATMPASCDAMFIACSQLPTREILAGLERDFGRPVWSSIRATAWQAMRESTVFSAGG